MATPRVPIPSKFLEKENSMAMTPSWFQFLSDLPSWITDTFATEVWSWLIEFPDDRDYDVVVNVPYATTVNSITTISTSGTCTLTGKINTTALGGTANSVSTAEQTQTHTTANDLVAGDNLRLTISANSGCENLSVTVKLTRAF